MIGCPSLSEPNVETRAPAGFAPYFDVAAEFLHDPLHHGEPQAGAVFLGGEERLKDAIAHVFRHAVPGVFDREARPLAAILIERRRRAIGADRERAAGGHGVAGIQAQVHQDLLERDVVADHGRDVGIEYHGGFDIARQDALGKPHRL